MGLNSNNYAIRRDRLIEGFLDDHAKFENILSSILNIKRHNEKNLNNISSISSGTSHICNDEL